MCCWRLGVFFIILLFQLPSVKQHLVLQHQAHQPCQLQQLPRQTKPPPPSAMPALPGPTSIPNVEDVKRAQELAAKMGLLLDLEFAPFMNLFPGYAIPDLSVPQKPVKLPVLRLDALRREMDGLFLLLSYQMGAYLNFCSI